MSWKDSVYRYERRDSRGRRNSGASQEEITFNAQAISAKEPPVKLLRHQQPTLGLECDDKLEEITFNAQANSAKEPPVQPKLLRRRQPTLGLERDDWKIPTKSAEQNIKSKTPGKRKEEEEEEKAQEIRSNIQKCSRNLSDEGEDQIKKLRDTDIFQEWIKNFGHDEARFPALFAKDKTLKDRFLAWAASFRRCDPRYQILKFFNDVAQDGADDIWKMEESTRASLPSIFNIFNRASVFTVWRPTSITAIRKMMLGEGVGKGLDIKGKSARKGKHSGFVPFMQIYEEKHKRQVRTLPKSGVLRIFYATIEARASVAEVLSSVCKEMVEAVAKAKVVIADETADTTDKETAFRHLLWDMEDPSIYFIDQYAPKCFGLEVPERLFWEAYVIRQECGREHGSEYDTGRPSEPAFQDMNFAALRNPPEDLAYRPVLWQFEEDDPMCPRNLLMAYEEQGRVMPVVSDFDCFLIGTRRVTYECNLAPEQLHLLKWSVDQMETILDSPVSKESFTARWLEVLKKEALKGFYPECPRFGFGDFKSYSVMQRACGRLLQNGCVRHGAECFNYYFPQELDSEFLVISDQLPGSIPWKYMKENELQEFLLSKIDAGFTMPLNPKWVLCDPGWKRVYDRLIKSRNQNIQTSMDVWFPPESGVREKIEAVHAKHPEGFQVRQGKKSVTPKKSSRPSLSGTALMDLGELELKSHVKLQKAKRKLFSAVSVMNFKKELTGTADVKTAALKRAMSVGVQSTLQQEDSSHHIKAGSCAAAFFYKLHRDLSDNTERSTSDLSRATTDGSERSFNSSDALTSHNDLVTKIASEEKGHSIPKTVQPTKAMQDAFLRNGSGVLEGLLAIEEESTMHSVENTSISSVVARIDGDPDKENTRGLDIESDEMRSRKEAECIIPLADNSLASPVFSEEAAERNPQRADDESDEKESTVHEMPHGAKDLVSNLCSETIDEESYQGVDESGLKECAPERNLSRHGSSGIVALTLPRMEATDEELIEDALPSPKGSHKPTLARTASQGIPLLAPNIRHPFSKTSSM